MQDCPVCKKDTGIHKGVIKTVFMKRLKELKGKEIPAKIFKENPKCRFYANSSTIYIVPKTTEMGVCTSITLVKRMATKTYSIG